MDGKERSASERSARATPEDKSKKVERRKELGRALRIAYQDVLDEPIPDQFSDILKRLDKV